MTKAKHLDNRRSEKERIWKIQAERMREAIDQARTNPTALAKALGMPATHFRDFLEGKKKSLSSATMGRAAEYLGCDLSWLAAQEGTPQTPRVDGPARPPAGTIPLYGQNPIHTDGRFYLRENKLADITRPPQLDRVIDPYAISISEISMEPRLRPGNIVFVDPSRAARVGDDVIVQIEIDGKLIAYLKELVKITPEEIVVKQLHDGKTLSFKKKDVKFIHTVSLISV